MITRRLLTLACVAALVPALGACGRDNEAAQETAPPPAVGTTAQGARVTNVALGRSVDAQGRIAGAGATNAFAARDTIYVSVHTEGGAAGSRLTARWTFQDGQVVDESSQTLTATGPAITEFHISNPGGFPTGSYQVEIQLDGRTLQTESFTVR